MKEVQGNGNTNIDHLGLTEKNINTAKGKDSGTFGDIKYNPVKLQKKEGMFNIFFLQIRICPSIQK